MAGHSSAPLKCCLNKEIELDKVVCRFYANSLCEDGDKCLFPHVPKEGRVLDSACRYFLRNKCHFGKLCALDHVNILDRNGKIVLQIIQQQLGARKRQLESQSFVIKEPPSPNIDQHAYFVGEPSGVYARAVLSTEREVANVHTPCPSKQCEKEKCLAIGSIKPILECEDRKMHETGSTEKYLQDFCRGGKVSSKGVSQVSSQTPERGVSNTTKKSENAPRSLKGRTQSDSESGENQMREAIAVKGESYDLRSCGTSQTPLQNLSMKRSEEERYPTSGYSKSDSTSEDLIPGGPFAAENGSQACGGTAAPQKPIDPYEPMVLYNTLIVPRGRTAEEIALFGEFSFLPVDINSRVPLYMRGATATESNSDYVGKQTGNAKRADENNVAKQTENAKRADENNGVSQQNIAEERFIYTPSGRRVGLNPQYYPYCPNQDRI